MPMHSQQVKTPTYNNGLIRNIISLEIDVVNLRTILRMIRDHVDPKEAKKFLISGGKEFDSRKLDHLLSLHSIEEVVEELKTTPYRFLADLPTGCHKDPEDLGDRKTTGKVPGTTGCERFSRRSLKRGLGYRVFLGKI